MDLWYSDYHVDDVRLSINVEREIYSHQTEF